MTEKDRPRLEEMQRQVAAMPPAEALERAQSARGEFPHMPAMVSLWIAGLRCQNSDPDGAIAELVHGVENGHWWYGELLDRHVQLRPLLERPDYAAVRAASEQLRQAAEAARDDADTDPVVCEPHGTPIGALIAMYGWAGRAAPFAKRWERAAQLGYVGVIPESPQRTVSDGMNGWIDDTLTLSQLARHYEREVVTRVAPDRPVILGGFSGGGRKATQFSVAGDPFPTAGFVSVSHGPPNRDALLPHLPSAAERQVRGYIAIGELDYARPWADEVRALLNQAGIEVEPHLVPDVGHQVPPDSSGWLELALDFVTARRFRNP